MKIVKINDNLKVNIEQIYSLEYSDNSKDINSWKNKYNELLNKFTDDPPTLLIGADQKIFTPDFSKNNNKEDLKLYSEELNKYIINIIGTCPNLTKKYSLILSSGLKINTTEEIYNKINEIFENYLI